MGWWDGDKRHTKGTASRSETVDIRKKDFDRKERREKPQRTQRKIVAWFSSRPSRCFFANFAVKGCRLRRG
jgi:hypothetical protein